MPAVCDTVLFNVRVLVPTFNAPEDKVNALNTVRFEPNTNVPVPPIVRVLNCSKPEVNIIEPPVPDITIPEADEPVIVPAQDIVPVTVNIFPFRFNTPPEFIVRSVIDSFLLKYTV